MLLRRNTNKKVDIINWQGDFSIWVEKQKQTPCDYLQNKTKLLQAWQKKKCYKKINKHTLLKNL
jgi:hypothetical protein